MSNFGSVPNVLGKNAVRATTWVFDASAKTLTVPGSGEAEIIYVTNVTDGVVIYNTANPATNAITTANRYLEFTFDTTAMSDDDELLIFCDVPEGVDDTIEILQNMLKETRLQTRLMLKAFSIELDELEEDEDDASS